MLHNITYQDTKLLLFKDRIGLFPISNIENGASLLNDFIETIQRERKQLRDLGMWPNTGTTNGVDFPFHVGNFNFFHFFASGIGRMFAVWSILCNVLVTIAVARMCFMICCRRKGQGGQESKNQHLQIEVAEPKPNKRVTWAKNESQIVNVIRAPEIDVSGGVH